MVLTKDFSLKSLNSRGFVKKYKTYFNFGLRNPFIYIINCFSKSSFLGNIIFLLTNKSILIMDLVRDPNELEFSLDFFVCE